MAPWRAVAAVSLISVTSDLVHCQVSLESISVLGSLEKSVGDLGFYMRGSGPLLSPGPNTYGTGSEFLSSPVTRCLLLGYSTGAKGRLAPVLTHKDLLW
jgi:hypothetical protein